MKNLSPQMQDTLATLAIAGLMAVAMLLSSCTVVRYTDGDTTLTVLDTRITGSAIDLSGTIDGVGSLDVNREQGGTEGVIGEVGDIVRPGILP